MNQTTHTAVSRLFDETNPNWHNKQAYNRAFLKSQEAYLNSKLDAQGYLFLNEVYRALGFPETQEGTRIGWKSEDQSVISVEFDLTEHLSGNYILFIRVPSDILHVLPEH